MSVASIVIKHNPITLWERFSLTLSPEEGKYQDFKQEDRDGGYYRASFNVYFDHVAASEFLENALGRQVEVYDHQSIKIFEGIIFEMVRDTGGSLSATSLQNMVNRVWMRSDHDGDQVVDRGTTLDVLKSQARYGIKEGVLSGGELEGLSVADQSAQGYLNRRAYPVPESDVGAGSGIPHLQIYCRGYIEYLTWRVYNQTILTGTQGASAQIKDVLDAVGDFVRSYDLGTNATPVTKEYDADRRALDTIQGITSLGDSQSRLWVAYMTDDQKFIYKQGKPTIPLSQT